MSGENIMIVTPCVSVGQFLDQEKSNQLHQNIQLSCANGRLLESQLIVSLVFYNIFRDFNCLSLQDSIIILPDHSVEELCVIFNAVYEQEYNKNESPANKEITGITNDNEVTQIKEELLAGGVEDTDEEQMYQGKIEEEFTPQMFEKCGLCNKMCATKGALNAHQIRFHRQQIKRKKVAIEGQIDIFGDDESELNYSCNACEYKTRRSDALKTHTERKHKDKDKMILSACDTCGYTSYISGNFKNHKKHCRQKSEQCSMCDKKCLTKEALRKHRKRLHKDEWEHHKAAKKMQNEITMIEKGKKTKEVKINENGEKKMFVVQTAVSISEESKQKLEQDKAEKAMKVICEFCPQLVSKDHLRKHHINIHKQDSVKKTEHIYPKVPCPHCSSLVSILTIRKHLRNSHNLRGGLGSIEVECNYCLIKLAITGFEYHVRYSCFARNK